VLAGGETTTRIGVLRDRAPLGGHATAYVCRRYVCETPTDDAARLREQLAVSIASEPR
jgi:uncharacterized protein YyaL (SSP411 family)